jgi:transposase-like protein
MPSKKPAPKGKRYTADEKQAVVDFVNNHNAENGRGGVTAAVKKFGATALTIASWVKAGSGAGKASKGRGASSASAASSKRGNVLKELSKLDGIIAMKRRELDALEARFQKLKESL